MERQLFPLPQCVLQCTITPRSTSSCAPCSVFRVMATLFVCDYGIYACTCLCMQCTYQSIFYISMFYMYYTFFLFMSDICTYVHVHKQWACSNSTVPCLSTSRLDWEAVSCRGGGKGSVCVQMLVAKSQPFPGRARGSRCVSGMSTLTWYKDLLSILMSSFGIAACSTLLCAWLPVL